MPSTAVILGVDHRLQQPVNQSQRSRFALRLRYQSELPEIVAVYRLRVCCEESKIGQESIAEGICAKEHIRYVNIDLPAAEREKHGIRPVYPDIPGEGPLTSPEEKAKNFKVREQWMREYIDEETRSLTSFDSALIICGSEHMTTIAEHLRGRFSHVIPKDVTKEMWFDVNAL